MSDNVRTSGMHCARADTQPRVRMRMCTPRPSAGRLHVRTTAGTLWNVYPMYDYAHALTDAQTKIQLGDELVRLPCEPKLSVVAILEEYVHHFTFNLLSNPKWNRSDNYRNLNSSGYGSGSEVSHLASSGGSAGIQMERGKPGGALPKVSCFSKVLI